MYVGKQGTAYLSGAGLVAGAAAAVGPLRSGFLVMTAFRQFFTQHWAPQAPDPPPLAQQLARDTKHPTKKFSTPMTVTP